MMTPHEMAVEIERALNNSGFFDYGSGFKVEPPDGEDEPDNFGISKDGKLLFIIRVEEW